MNFRSIQKHYPSIVTGILLLGFVAFVSSNTVTAESLRSAFMTHPQPYSELYFNEPAKIPPTIEARVPYNLSFTIVNQEGTPKNYQYRVTIVENGKERVVSGGQLLLEDGQPIRIPAVLSANSKGSSLELIVELPLQNQVIHIKRNS